MSWSLSDLAGVEVDTLPGVGERHAEALGQVGIRSVLDLLTHYPRRYIDRTHQASMSELSEGSEAMVLGVVRRVTARPTRSRRSMVEADLSDGRGYLHLTFFNQPWRAKQLEEGKEVVVWGKVERYRGRTQMTNPVVDLVGDRTGRVVAVYPQSEKAGLASWKIGQHVEAALERYGDLLDPLPPDVLEEVGVPGRAWAMWATHLPESPEDKDRGRRRLGFDELLRLQLVLVLRKRKLEEEAVGIRHSTDGGLVGRFLGGLPFPLTGAQSRAIDEVRADLAGPHPMHRLLQGDVGSGKTIVAVATLLTAVEGGHQGALMAPTEVLAEQHHAGIRRLLDGLSVPAPAASLLPERPLEVALLTNRTSGAARSRLLRGLADGSVDLVVGTHALLSENVEFADLGAVVIDEQHRFGVEQRAALRERGAGGAVPDVLVMTATPIPRTAAMTVFGDLDTTVVDELPPGRRPVETVRADGALAEAGAWDRVRAEVQAGRQAYVVCPLVEGSDKVEARSATEERDRLAAAELAGMSVGLLHGQLPAAEKEAVMEEYRLGRLQVLVATTVIEVGVDVPNATVMVIEDADRFGLAQLHQLRGRVGRGGERSWCYLLGQPATEDGNARLEALVAHSDGFALAEIDLDLRGEGTILGARQKGVSDLKLASLRRHRSWVERARRVAVELVAAHPGLDGLPELAAELRAMVNEEEADYLFKG